MGAVCADEEVEGDFDLWGAVGGGTGVGVASIGYGETVLEPGSALLEVRTRELVVEVEGYIWECLEGIEEALVETASVDCVDGLGVVSFVRGVAWETFGTLPWTS